VVEIPPGCGISCLRSVSVLYREPMWLKFAPDVAEDDDEVVSVLYREPMWLKLLVLTTQEV